MNYISMWNELNTFNDTAVVIRVFLAMLLGGFIGLEREKSKRPAGFRTHILVCVGSSMTSLIALFIFNKFGDVTDLTRISAQVISGIGFLGVGTILVKERDHITGLTTAAGLWTTAVIGIACGYGFYIIALLGTLVVAVTSAILFKLEAGSRKRNRVRSIYLEIKDTKYINEYTDWMYQELKAKNIHIQMPKSGIQGNIGIEIVLSFLEDEEVKAILKNIRAKENVVFAMDNIRKDVLRN